MVGGDDESVGPVTSVSPDTVGPSPERQNQLREMERLAKDVKDKAARRMGIVVVVVVLALAFVAIGGLPGHTIDQGERGVMTSFGKTSPDPLQPGLGFKWPIIQAVHTYPVRVLVHSAPASSGAPKICSWSIRQSLLTTTLSPPML